MEKSLLRVAKGTLHFSIATFLSRILGFLRDVVIAFTLGAGPLTDSFFVAFRIPNLLRRLFAEGSLTMAFVPIFTSIKEVKGLQDAYNFSRSLFFWLFFCLGVITTFVILFARPVCLVIAPGFSSSTVLDFTAKLLRICFPYIIFISGVAVCMGILNSLGHFFIPAAAPCVLNCCLIISALVGWRYNLSIPVLLSIGVLAAGILQFLIQQPVLFKYGFSWRGKVNLKDKELLNLLKKMGPTVFGSAIYQITILINTLLASFLPLGSISYLYYADRLVQFPLGVFGVALGAASLPSLSKLVVRNKRKEFITVLNKSVYLNFFISLPATAGLIGLRYPIIDILFKRGAFSTSDVKATAMALLGYSLGLPAYCVLRTMVSAFYSYQDTKTPVKAGFFSLLLNITLAVILMDKYNYFGLALASALSSWLNLLLLAYYFDKKISGWFSCTKDLFFLTVLSVIIGFGSYYSYSFFHNWSLFLMPVWVVFYGVMCWALKVEAFHLMKQGMFEKI